MVDNFFAPRIDDSLHDGNVPEANLTKLYSKHNVKFCDHCAPHFIKQLESSTIFDGTRLGFCLLDEHQHNASLHSFQITARLIDKYGYKMTNDFRREFIKRLKKLQKEK